MKKTLALFAVLLFASVSLFSEQYQIIDAEYSVKGSGFSFLGKTRPYVLKQKFPLDKKKTFNSREELENYIKNYEETLISSRDFDSVTIDYESTVSENEVQEVRLIVDIVDSHHMLAVPLPKYTTENGASVKIKAKDTNFLGTLNTMNMSLDLGKNTAGDFIPELSFDFDYPFSIGNIDATFVNDYSLSYIVSNKEYKRGFEWDAKTGLQLSIPFEFLPLSLGIYQYVNGDLDYKYYEEEEESYFFKDNEDYLYFAEELTLGTSFKLTEFSNYTSLSYSPSIGIKWNWDGNGINNKNYSLASPTLSFSHSISNGKVNWNNNFRKGYNFSLSNSYSYTFIKNDLIPSVRFDAEYYFNYIANDQEYWNQYGICSRFHSFYYFEVPTNGTKKRDTESFDGRLRGVLGSNCGSYYSGFVLNLDLPHNVFTTDFKTQIINFNLQFSPFFDMAIYFDKNSEGSFNLYNNGYYCGGFEMLVNPLKWSSYTVRASLGIDLKGASHANNFLEAITNNMEIFIGIGLHY